MIHPHNGKSQQLPTVDELLWLLITFAALSKRFRMWNDLERECVNFGLKAIHNLLFMTKITLGFSFSLSLTIDRISEGRKSINTIVYVQYDYRAARTLLTRSLTKPKSSIGFAW